MIIRGILDSSLNGQLCIRGFAPIKELARISNANYKYQRKPLAEQEETIRYFLDTEPYLFFPEIILSLKIKHSFDDKKMQTPLCNKCKMVNLIGHQLIKQFYRLSPLITNFPMIQVVKTK